MTSLNVLGVTCAESAKWLVAHCGRELTITFDQRPKSFQFLQLYICSEIMAQESGCRYGFYFSLDKDFMVKNVIDEAIKHGKVKTYFPEGVISDDENKFLGELVTEKFYSLENSVKKNIQADQLDFILDADDIIQDILNNKVSELIKMQTEHLDHKFSLKIKFHHIGFLGQIREYLKFDEIIFELDQEVMLGYRQIDYQKLEQSILKIKEFNQT
jgi:hypothetical protein